MKNIKKENRLNWIDSLRGFAALAVAIMHLFEQLRKLYPSVSMLHRGTIVANVVHDFFNFGKIGVVVFFLISGYVIPFSLKNKNLEQFAITRFFRLYPAYWLSILLFIIIFGFPSFFVTVANITMFQKFFGIKDLVGVYWTLQIELIFYFICALMFHFKVLFNKIFLIKTFYTLLFTSLIVATIRYVIEVKLPVAAPLGLSVMFLGMLWKKHAEDNGIVTRNNMITYLISFILVLLPICFLAYNKDYGFDETWYKYFVSYCAALLIFVLFYQYKWSSKPANFLGSISYSLYLLHPLVGMEIVRRLKLYVWPQLDFGYYIILFLLFSVFSATLCYYLIEKPSVKMGKRLFALRVK